MHMWLLMHEKLQKLMCVHNVACSFGMRMWDSEHMWHMRDAHHELTLGLPHYTCGVATDTVALGNEICCFDLIGFFICCNEHCLKRHGLIEYNRIFSCH